ncbi:hypothetical protein [Streptomyces chartreusis]|uniref:hypothetical protein n=1 Tax=Streptomyces chartreusis TaxID=1969 RepID=UPI00381FC2D0
MKKKFEISSIALSVLASMTLSVGLAVAVDGREPDDEPHPEPTTSGPAPDHWYKLRVTLDSLKLIEFDDGLQAGVADDEGAELRGWFSIASSAGKKTKNFNYMEIRNLRAVGATGWTADYPNPAKPVCYGYYEPFRSSIWVGLRRPGEYTHLDTQAISQQKAHSCVTWKDEWEFADYATTWAARAGGKPDYTGMSTQFFPWEPPKPLASMQLCDGEINVAHASQPRCSTNNNSFEIWVKAGSGGSITYDLTDEDKQGGFINLNGDDDRACKSRFYFGTDWRQLDGALAANRGIPRVNGSQYYSGYDGRCSLRYTVTPIAKSMYPIDYRLS